MQLVGARVVGERTGRTIIRGCWGAESAEVVGMQDVGREGGGAKGLVETPRGGGGEGLSLRRLWPSHSSRRSSITLIVRWIRSMRLVDFETFDGRGEIESNKTVSSVNAEFTSLFCVGVGGVEWKVW